METGIALEMWSTLFTDFASKHNVLDVVVVLDKLGDVIDLGGRVVIEGKHPVTGGHDEIL